MIEIGYTRISDGNITIMAGLKVRLAQIGAGENSEIVKDVDFGMEDSQQLSEPCRGNQMAGQSRLVGMLPEIELSRSRKSGTDGDGAVALFLTTSSAPWKRKEDKRREKREEEEREEKRRDTNQT